MNTMVSLLKREHWEHQVAFRYLPLVLAGLMLLVMLLASVSAVQVNAQWGHGSDSGMEATSFSDMLRGMEAAVPTETRNAGVRSGLLSLAVPFGIVMGFVSIFYFISCLYDERKDRSILFWKSMPVSDMAVVGAKILTGFLVIPLIFWVAALVTQLGGLIIGTGVAISAGIPAWSTLWAPSQLPLLAFTELGAFYIALLWLAPILGWFLLVSVYINRAPLLAAIVPVLLAAILEGWIWHSSELLNWVGERFSAAVMTLSLPIARIAAGQGAELQALTDGNWSADTTLISIMAEPQFWLGIGIFALCAIGAWYMRRYRDES